MAVTKPFFVSPLDLGTIATGNETSGFPAINVNRMKAPGLSWKSTGNTNVWIRGQFASSQSIDFLSIISANALVGTQFRLRLGTSQAQVDGTAPYDSGTLTFISPSITRSDGLYNSHLEIGSVQTATWWRIDITGHTGDFQAAKVVMGAKIQTAKFYNWDFQYGVKDLGDLNIGRFGVMDEEPGVMFRTVDFTMAWNTEAEFEAYLRPLVEKVGRRGIVFLCFDPTSNTYRQARSYLGVLDKPPYAKGVRKPATFTMDWSLISYI